jgi:hypothetical protein
MMRKTLSIPAMFFCLLILASGCKKSYILNDNQMVLFQYEYINYAWGYQHSGFYIDNDGNVLKYEKPEGWNFSDSENVLSSARLFENLNKCTVSEKIISSSELTKYSRHIENIASSKVTAPKNVGADMGSIRYYCYRYDKVTDTYKCYLIKMEGDYTCENLNYYSKKVVSWMEEIRRDITIK